MAQLMPLPPTVSCSSKIQIGFTFLVPAHLGSPGQRAIKRMYVCTPWLLLNEDASWNKQSVIGRLFGTDNRPADNRPKHYWCTSKQDQHKTVPQLKLPTGSKMVITEHTKFSKETSVIILRYTASRVIDKTYKASKPAVVTVHWPRIKSLLHPVASMT